MNSEETLPHPPSIDRDSVVKPEESIFFSTPPPKVPFSPFSPENLKSNTLKKKNAVVSFVKYDLTQQRMLHQTISLRERMRDLDNFHLHRPHPEDECQYLNLPNNRLNLHVVKDIVYLCGGLVGVRFEGDELKAINSFATHLQNCWVQLEQRFKSMTSSDLKHVPSNPNDTIISSEATQFCELADKYMMIVASLQELVKKKQSTIDRTNAITTGNDEPFQFRFITRFFYRCLVNGSRS